METIGRIYKTQKKDASSSEQTNISTAILPHLFGLSHHVLLLIHPPLFSSTMSLRVGDYVIMGLGRWAGGGMKEWKQHGSILLPEGDSFPAQKCLHSSFHTCQQSTLGEERLIGEMDSLSLHWNNQICWNLQEPAECPRPLQSPEGTPEHWMTASACCEVYLFLHQSNTDFVGFIFILLWTNPCPTTWLANWETFVENKWPSACFIYLISQRTTACALLTHSSRFYT